MSWVAVGVAGGSALLGTLNAQQQQKQHQQDMIANAEAIRQSPWTGMKASLMSGSSVSPALAGAQGALGGYMQGRNIVNANKANDLAEKKSLLEIEDLKRKQLGMAFSPYGTSNA